MGEIVNQENGQERSATDLKKIADDMAEGYRKLCGVSEKDNQRTAEEMKERGKPTYSERLREIAPDHLKGEESRWDTIIDDGERFSREFGVNLGQNFVFQDACVMRAYINAEKARRAEEKGEK